MFPQCPLLGLVPLPKSDVTQGGRDSITLNYEKEADLPF
jgi:hypothetical protein